jgi:hypothetical protein
MGKMPQTIREFGHYKITSEKIDDCPCKYDDFIILMAMSIGLFSALFCVASIQCKDLIFSCIFFIIGVVGCLGGLYISDSTYNCGTKISLKDINYTDLDIKSESFQFTKNPDSDALEIENIISGFEKYANEIDIVNKKREDEKRMKSKLCCNKYKSVIEKVK